MCDKESGVVGEMCVMRRNKGLWATECGCGEIVDKNLKK